MRSEHVYVFDGLVCKINKEKVCYFDNPDCANCSKNPQRDANRKITSGQAKFLVESGLDPVLVSNMSYIQAGKEIRKLKKF